MAVVPDKKFDLDQGTYTDLVKVIQTDTGQGVVSREVVVLGGPEGGYATVNRISTTSFNSRSAATLTAAATFQGVGEDVSAYGRVGVAITSDNATDGVLTMEVSHDNVTWGGPTRSIADTRFAQPHMWNIVEKYFRIKYVNGTTEADNLSIQVQYSNNADVILGHQLNETLLDETEAIITRSVLVGKTDGGDYVNVPVNGDGELIIEQPHTAFGQLSVASEIPLVALMFNAQLHPDLINTRLNGGNSTADVHLNRMRITTSANANNFAQLLSKGLAQYRPGVGIVTRFTTVYTTGVANSTQIMGIGDAGNGFFFGYNGAAFGVLHRTSGKPEIKDFTITVGANAGNITVTLDGDTKVVAVSTTADREQTVIDIATADYSNVGDGWTARARGYTCQFQSWTTGAKSGTFDVTGSNVSVTVGDVITGVAATDTWIAQTSWNADQFLGSGGSGTTLDPTKGNIYQIRYQWLGYGKITFYIEHPEDGKMEEVHAIEYANTSEFASIQHPTLPLCALVSNGSNTSDLRMHSGSMAAFSEGEIVEQQIPYSHVFTSTFTDTTADNCISLHCNEVFFGELNRIGIFFEKLTVNLESGKDVLIEIWRDIELDNSSWTTHGLGSIAQRSVGTGGMAVGTGRLVNAFPVTGTGSVTEIEIGLRIDPGQVVTITGLQLTAGTNSVCRCVARWHEEY